MKKRIALIFAMVLTLTGCGIKKDDNGNVTVWVWEDEEEYSNENMPDMEWEQEDIQGPDILIPDDLDAEYLISDGIIEENVNPYWERKESTKYFGKDRVKLKDVKPLESMWQFSLNHMVITMPCSIQDLVNAGCVIQPSVGSKPINEVIPANSHSFLITLSSEAPNGELLYFNATVDNTKDYDCSIYNRTVYALDIFPFNGESLYRKFNFYVADGVGFDNKYYDAYDYYVENPSDDDYYCYDEFPRYKISDGDDRYVCYDGLDHDDYLDCISWKVSDHSEEIVPDEEFRIPDKKYTREDLPECVKYTGLAGGIMFDNEFTLNGVPITLPCSIGDLLSAGYLPKDKVSSEMEIFANERWEIEFVEDGAPENTLVATVANWGDKSVTMSDDCIHIIRFNCKQFYDDSTTIMIKLGNGMTPYVDMGTFMDRFGTEHVIDGESYEFQTVFRAADPPAGFDGTFFDVVEYVFDGSDEDSKLMSILLGADLPSGTKY